MDDDTEDSIDPSIHACLTCGSTLVRLDVTKCVDQSRYAHQCPKCKTNDRDKSLGPYVYDMLEYCSCAVCSRLESPGTVMREQLERDIIRLVLGDIPPEDPVQRLDRTQILARADAVSRDLLNTTREDAFARLERGELSGTLAEPELRMLRDMLDRTSDER